MNLAIASLISYSMSSYVISPFVDKTDAILVVAARALADQVTQAELDSGLLSSLQNNTLPTEIVVEVKVAETIFARNLAAVDKPRDVRRWIEGPHAKPEDTSRGS
jgi:malate dehydrogenase (oxaloacetate-decarboxylating)(NADP+)